MSDQGEVSEVSLNTLVQDHGGFGVTERRPVLIQEIHQLLCDQPGHGNIAITDIIPKISSLPGGQQQLFPPVLFPNVLRFPR